jgi:hypothetical protein
MDKKDIYEHLANIYLDASLKKKKKGKENNYFKKLFFGSLAVIFGLSIFMFGSAYFNRPARTSYVSLVLYPDTVRINFNFGPAKKEICSIGLNKLNLSRYKALSFSLKKNNYFDKIALRVEFTNPYNESSHLYLTDIPADWKEYKINLAQFKGISDWTEMSNLSFIIEEWNAKEKKDIVYIENIRVLR